MDANRWQRINDIFQDALACDVGSRDARVARGCDGDDALREAVERLLRAHERAAGFLEVPAAANAGPLVSPRDPPTAVVEHFSRYQVGSEFRGTERFAVRRRLGAGGMGVVYEAHDRLRDEVVALKTLLHANATDIYRLKREFRSLADIAHPNLVSLYELFVEADTCFFTMELVSGRRISEVARAMAGIEPDRVRRMVRQLVTGLLELHAKGKLHRDIKPSNVFVVAHDRVVILDFGLASDAVSDLDAGPDRLAGTPAYLAPEQLRGAPPSEATDWYAVGVTLYEALTERLPFDGSGHELGTHNAQGDPVPPSIVDGDVPADLSELCMGLLNPDPARRWSGQQVLDRLAAATALPLDGAGYVRPRPRAPFIGRTHELEVLEAAVAALDERRPAALAVHGPSGIGKTALVQHVLDGAVGRGALVLRGRCYEHEFVPFKALDGIVDSLSAYLGSLPRDVAAELLPPDVASLARAFPVMLQVEAVAIAHRSEAPGLDPSAQRRAAFSALRALLTTIAERRALVIHIDDLHWADPDSAQLLDDLLQPPAPPPLLMLVCVRAEEMASRPHLQAWLDGTGASRAHAVRLAPMTDEEARDVIASVLPAGLSQRARLDIAREAGGNPFLLEQLAYHVADDSSRLEHDATLADMLYRRCGRLSDGARRFLDVLALCGRPMAPDVVHQAAGLTGDERRLVAMLRADHLVRNSGSASRVEPYHDRIRETLAARLSSEDARAIHAALVRTLTANGVDDPDVLFEHCRGSGDRAAASRYAAAAARKARAALAFDRAASLYRSALELAPASSAAGEWTEELAEALTSAGRPREAAELYLAASRTADRSKQVELRRRAAEQFLAGGHIDRGTEVIRTVLAAVNLRLASSPLAAVIGLVWRRARLRWRGLDHVEREADQLPADTLLRIDTCWSVVTGLALVDTIRAAEFNTRHLLLALDAGEPYRLARALTLEAGFLGSDRTQATHARICFEHAEAMVRRSGQPHAEAMLALQAGSTALLEGEWKTATVRCRRALHILREQCVGVTWEINYAETLHLGSLLFQGEIREVARRVPALLVEAKDRGNLSFETELRTRMNVVWLAADQADEGERQANEAMEAWSHQGFHRQHYNHLLARLQTELYRGRAEAAWELVERRWRSLERTLLLRVPFLEIEARYLRARVALLMAARGPNARRFLSIARADARRIGRSGQAWSDAIAGLLTSGVAHLEGRDRDARSLLAATIAGFERADMKYHAAVARRRLGQLHADTAGHTLVREADDWIAGQGIVNAARISRVIAPGFPDP